MDLAVKLLVKDGIAHGLVFIYRCGLKVMSAQILRICAICWNQSLGVGCDILDGQMMFGFIFDRIGLASKMK